MKIVKKLCIQYKEVLLYLIFGVLTTLVNIVTYALSTKIFHIDWQVSNVIAWVLSVLFAYITNRKYVFESKDSNVIREMISFVIFRLVSFVLDMGFMYLFIDMMHVNDMISKIIVQVIVIVLNYVFSKLFIFKK